MSRIDVILKYLNEDVPSFAQTVGVSPELIYMIQKGTRNVSKSLANKIQSWYGIPFDYSYNGAGELKIDSTLMEIKDHSAKESTGSYSPSLSTKDHGAPYYDIDFIGGFDLVFNNEAIKPSYYIDFKPFNDVDCWINVTGKSMGPLIAHGDIVALKKLNSWKEFLLLGEIYAVVTPEFRTIKIVGKGKDDDHYTLIPYNKGNGYGEQPIPKHLITHIFRVTGSLKKFF